MRGVLCELREAVLEQVGKDQTDRLRPAGRDCGAPGVPRPARRVPGVVASAPLGGEGMTTPMAPPRASPRTRAATRGAAGRGAVGAGGAGRRRGTWKSDPGNLRGRGRAAGFQFFRIPGFHPPRPRTCRRRRPGRGQLQRDRPREPRNWKPEHLEICLTVTGFQVFQIPRFPKRGCASPEADIVGPSSDPKQPFRVAAIAPGSLT